MNVLDTEQGNEQGNGQSNAPQAEPRKPNVGLQAGAAAVLAVAAVGAMWALGVFEKTPKVAVACAPAKAGDSTEYPALCAALNRKDLPQLLGTPDEVASVAYSTGGTSTAADGTKQALAATEVQVGTYDVDLSDARSLTLKDFTSVFSPPSATTTAFLGHPALTYSDHTMAITFDGNGSSSGTGGLARHLLVAKSAKDGSGFLEIVLYRQDGLTPDDATLLRVAQQVLPHAPGWVATP